MEEGGEGKRESGDTDADVEDKEGMCEDDDGASTEEGRSEKGQVEGKNKTLGEVRGERREAANRLPRLP